AGLCAALHASDRSPRLSVTVVVKGLLGRAGCTRMVQGGYNAVLTEPDSLDAHFLDTLAGGGWINDQELVWTLVVEAPGRVLELESRYGCLFDRTSEGRIHQKPFAGQTHDGRRTDHVQGGRVLGGQGRRRDRARVSRRAPAPRHGDGPVPSHGTRDPRFPDDRRAPRGRATGRRWTPSQRARRAVHGALRPG